MLRTVLTNQKFRTEGPFLKDRVGGKAKIKIYTELRDRVEQRRAYSVDSLSSLDTGSLSHECAFQKGTGIKETLVTRQINTATAFPRWKDFQFEEKEKMVTCWSLGVWNVSNYNS